MSLTSFVLEGFILMSGWNILILKKIFHQLLQFGLNYRIFPWPVGVMTACKKQEILSENILIQLFHKVRNSPMLGFVLKQIWGKVYLLKFFYHTSHGSIPSLQIMTNSFFSAKYVMTIGTLQDTANKLSPLNRLTLHHPNNGILKRRRRPPKGRLKPPNLQPRGLVMEIIEVKALIDLIPQPNFLKKPILKIQKIVSSLLQRVHI